MFHFIYFSCIDTSSPSQDSTRSRLPAASVGACENHSARSQRATQLPQEAEAGAHRSGEGSALLLQELGGTGFLGGRPALFSPGLCSATVGWPHHPCWSPFGL